MLEVKIGDIYRYGAITQESSWKELYARLEEYGYINNDKEILLDFEGILLNNSESIHFNKLLKNENIHMRFYDKDDFVRKLQLIAIMDGYNKLRFTNVEPEKEVQQLSPNEKAAEQFAVDFASKAIYEDNGETVRLRVKDKIFQLRDLTTMAKIKRAFEIILEDNRGIKLLILDINDIGIAERAIEDMVAMRADIQNRYKVEMAFDVEDEQYIKEIELYMHDSNKKEYSIEDKVREVIGLGKNTAGILTKYKSSRAVDNFGRHGKGEVVSSRICILKDISKSRNGNNVRYLAKFRVFSEKTFYTQMDYAMRDEEVENNMIPSVEVVVDIAELGLTDKYLGSKYHFSLPIQEKEKDSISMYVLGEDNKPEIVRVTIPERMKYVFEDYEIEYNKLNLERAIRETRKYIKE